MKTSKKTLPWLVCLIIGKTFVAQPAPAKIYNMQQCIDIALKNNENLRTADFNIDYQKQNKKNSTEIPKTAVMYTQGQFNSIYKYDENITVTQAIPFPTVFGRKMAVAKAQIKSSEYNYAATKADLIYQVKTTYYSLIYSNAVHELLSKEDSIYQDFAKSVTQKYLDGKGTLLEKTAAETQVMETQNQLLESDEDINSYFIQLHTLMNTMGDFDIIYTDLTKNFLDATIDTSIILDHPLLKSLKEQVEVDHRTIALERARIMPDIAVSYFNQTIYGPANIFGDDYFLTKRNRLQGFIVGAAIPLWIHPLKSKVEAARLNQKVAQSAYDYNSTVMQGQYNQAITLYLKYRKSLNFYKTNALTNSKIIIEQALKSYNKAEISYVDYLQVVGHALNIENNYLNVINNNNMMALKIEYLLTK